MQKLIKNECIQKQLAYRTHSCKQPLVWEPTPLSTVPLSLGFEDHIRHYILYISLVALIAKVFLHGRKLAQRGRRTPPVNFPWYGNPPPYPLSHSGYLLFLKHFWKLLKPGQVLMSSNPSGSTLGNISLEKHLWD